jgi:hypothetical protein
MFYTMNKSIVALIIFSTAAVLAACNGNSVFNNPPGSGTNCGGPPSANQVQVLYPIPGATNAPPGLGTLYISSKGQLPSNQFNLGLALSNGGLLGTSPFFGTSASKIPKPHATPTYSNPTYYATSLGPSVVIGPNQSVSVLWSQTNACTPRTQISSFSTGS